MRVASSRFGPLSLALVLTVPPSACGDDDGGETTVATTSPTTTTPTSSTTTTDADTTTAASAGSTVADATTADTTTADETAADTTTAPTGDPTYPPIDAGSCPDGTVPVMLPGAQLCAPFCGDAADMCPMAATGDAPAACTPFAGQGGSGDPCDEITPCPEGEACGQDGTCGEVVFWACQLLCSEGQTCPNDMACSGIGTCGYP